MFTVTWVNLVVQILNHMTKLLLGLLVQVGDRDPSGQHGIVWVSSSLVRCSLSGQVVQFHGGYTIVDPLNDPAGNLDGVDVVGIEPVA